MLVLVGCVRSECATNGLKDKTSVYLLLKSIGYFLCIKVCSDAVYRQRYLNDRYYLEILISKNLK